MTSPDLHGLGSTHIAVVHRDLQRLDTQHGNIIIKAVGRIPTDLRTQLFQIILGLFTKDFAGVFTEALDSQAVPIWIGRFDRTVRVDE